MTNKTQPHIKQIKCQRFYLQKRLSFWNEYVSYHIHECIISITNDIVYNRSVTKYIEEMYIDIIVSQTCIVQFRLGRLSLAIRYLLIVFCLVLFVSLVGLGESACIRRRLGDYSAGGKGYQGKSKVTGHASQEDNLGLNIRAAPPTSGFTWLPHRETCNACIYIEMIQLEELYDRCL